MIQGYNVPQQLIDSDKPARIRVCFREVLTYTVLLDPLTKRLTGSIADFQHFQASAKDLYETSYGEPCSKALELFSAQRCNQHILNVWSRHSSPIRGFESIVNPHVGHKLNRDRGCYVPSVLIAQSLLRQQNADGNEVDTEKFIAHVVAVKHSANARNFAYIMGKQG